MNIITTNQSLQKIQQYNIIPLNKLEPTAYNEIDNHFTYQNYIAKLYTI